MSFRKLSQKYDNRTDIEPVDAKAMKSELQNIMWSGAGIFRTEKTLTSALEGIISISERLNRTDICLSKEEYELRNMLITAKLIVECALHRKESRGAHYRIDYLNTNEVCEHSIINKTEGEINFVK